MSAATPQERALSARRALRAMYMPAPVGGECRAARIRASRTNAAREQPSAVAVVVILMVYVLTGMVTCLLLPVLPERALFSVPVPAAATCLRATRLADHARVRVPLGRPSRVRSFVLRFELAPAGAPSLRNFAYEASESRALRCEWPEEYGGDAACTDVAVLAGRPGAVLRRRVVQFRLGHYTQASLDYTGPAGIGADGSLYEGQFLHGVQEGEGAFVSVEGERYIGQWSAGGTIIFCIRRK